MKNSKNGITLIALVITIIVLLILAGISISLVTGQNGVLTRAEDASNTYSMSSAKEQANMRAAGYVSEYTEKVYVDNDLTVGSMTTGEYVLSQINGEEDGDYRYSVSGSAITVTSKTTGETLASGTIGDDGGIAWSDTVSSNNETPVETSENARIPATAEEVNSLIGTIVEYTGYSADYTGEWQVFYATADELFIIPKYVIERNTRIDTYNSEYLGSASVRNMSYGLAWNKNWLDICNQYSESTYTNAKATAYLCDSTKWTRYVSSKAPEGTYAVGGPTIELLVSSVTSSGATLSKNYKKCSQDSGYDYRGDELTGMYVNSGYYWSLASPIANGWDNNDFPALYTIGGNGTIDYETCLEKASNKGLRPLVSIPMSSVTINNNVIQISMKTEY